MLRSLLVFSGAIALAGCVHVSMDPIEVNANVTVNVKVDRELDNFFGDLDKKSATLMTPSAKS